MRRSLLAILLLSTGLCSAKKMQMGIDDVILSADLVVIGEIKHNGIGSYSFEVQETLYGDTSLRTIHVDKWKEWTCDWRSFEIEKGQRLVLLLNKGRSGYNPINASTGEIPIVNDSLAEQSGPYPVLPYRLSLNEFGNAVRQLRACCHITDVRNDFGNFYDWTWDCPPEQRATHTSKADFTAWLFRRMESRNKTP